jgi:thioredoxin
MKEAIFSFLIALVIGAGINGLVGAGLLANPSPMEKPANAGPSVGATDGDASLVAETGDSSWNSDVVSSSTPVFVDFYEDGCQPCKEMEPVISKLANEYKGKVKFLKVNAMQAPATISRYSVQALPTFYVFKDGKTVDSYMGIVPYSVLKGVMDRVSATASAAPSA